MKKPSRKEENSSIPYLYLIIATVLILIPLLLVWYGTPDARLLKAVNRCDPEAARHALDNGANVNVKTSEDDIVGKAPALFLAARNGCADIVALLLTHKADVNMTVAGSLYPGWTALMAAAEKGQINIVQLLLQHGVNTTITATDGEYKGWTALKIAEAQGHAEIIALLKEKGIN